MQEIIDTFFQALQDGNPLYWLGFLVALFFTFKLLKNMSKVIIILLILGAILYSVHYFNPEFLESLIKSLVKRFN
ncbi:MAG: hypothetical protein CML08_00235 [Puniceicoccaceae bacterium]|nr:hypothetical protein [Puniceicoccaceae bacterium]|tara:strand:+ start:1454 stop:1678 length:225 start_codon:yes stop_codon:yes gene_type:complete